MEIASKRSWSRLPLGLLGMVALVVLIEIRIAPNWVALATGQVLGMHFAMDAAKHNAPGASVLIFGDSVVKCGIMPTEAERVLGPDLRVYNLAVAGTPTPIGWSIYQRAIAAGAKPKAVILGCLNLTGNPRGHATDFAEVLTPAETIELSVVSRDATLWGKATAAMLFPSLRYRTAIRIVALETLLRGTGFEEKIPGAHTIPGRDVGVWTLRAWGEQGGVGANPADLKPVDKQGLGKIDERVEREVINRPWAVHAAFLYYLKQIALDASSRGSKVFLLVPPIHPLAQAQRDRNGFDAHHTKNLRGILEKIPGIVLVDARRTGYPAEDFHDAVHLNVRGATRLTTELARLVQTRLSETSTGPQWVTLPRHQPVDAAPSQLAIQPAPERR